MPEAFIRIGGEVVPTVVEDLAQLLDNIVECMLRGDTRGDEDDHEWQVTIDA